MVSYAWAEQCHIVPPPPREGGYTGTAFVSCFSPLQQLSCWIVHATSLPISASAPPSPCPSAGGREPCGTHLPLTRRACGRFNEMRLQRLSPEPCFRPSPPSAIVIRFPFAGTPILSAHGWQAIVGLDR